MIHKASQGNNRLLKRGNEKGRNRFLPAFFCLDLNRDLASYLIEAGFAGNHRTACP